MPDDLLLLLLLSTMLLSTHQAAQMRETAQMREMALQVSKLHCQKMAVTQMVVKVDHFCYFDASATISS